MGKYFGCGKYNNYYKYIFLTIFFSLISTLLFGNGQCNDSHLMHIAKAYPEKTKNTQESLSNHIIIHNIYRNIGILIISIISYKYEKYYSKSKKEEENNKNTGIQLIYEDTLLKYEKKSSLLFVIFIILLYNIQDILTLLYFRFDLSKFNLWILELPLLSYFNYKILKIKIYSHHKFAMYLSVIICLTSKIISLFLHLFLEEFKYLIYNQYKFLYIIGVFSYLIIIIIRAYSVTEIKVLIDLRYISPNKLLIISGIVGILINSAIIVISTFNKCEFKNIDIHLCNVVEDINKDEAYLDNFFIYYKILRNSVNSGRYYEVIIEVLTSFVGIIIYFFFIYFYISIIKYLTPIHVIFYALIYAFIVRIIIIFISINNNSYFNQEIFNIYILILNGIADFFSGFGICIYLEIIELNFCDFNRNLRRNIIIRSKEELNIDNINKQSEKIGPLIDDGKDYESEVSNLDSLTNGNY